MSEYLAAPARRSSSLGVIASRLVGMWTLVSYTEERDGLEDSDPFGDRPEGFLIYTLDQFVSAQLMRPGRPFFQSHDWRGGTPEEYQEAGKGYIAYCGIWEVDERKQTVTHIPSVALVPNLIHARHVRSVTFNGDLLTLRATDAHAQSGVSLVSRLEWKRAENSDGSCRP